MVGTTKKESDFVMKTLAKQDFEKGINRGIERDNKLKEEHKKISDANKQKRLDILKSKNVTSKNFGVWKKTKHTKGPPILS